jgi:hypothetical protein
VALNTRLRNKKAGGEVEKAPGSGSCFAGTSDDDEN